VFRLEPPKPYRLGHAPLAQALVQLNFPLQARLSNLEGMAPIQDLLGGRYPTLTQRHVQGIQFEMSSEGPPQAMMAGGNIVFDFASDDGHRLAFSPHQVVMSASSSYGGVADFLGRFGELAHVLADVVRVPRVDRIGVRYISLAESLPGDEDAWRAWFKPEIVGWTSSGIIEDETKVHLSIQQTMLSSQPVGELADFPADVQTAVRQGIAPAGSVIPASPDIQIAIRSFLLDLDASAAGAMPCDQDLLGRHFQTLHAQIDRFFRWSLTPEGENYFELSED
jgi:uncharacterized protein (TIGR04255 family)